MLKLLCKVRYTFPIHPPNKPVCTDRPSCFFARDFNACGVAGGGTTGALARLAISFNARMVKKMSKNFGTQCVVKYHRLNVTINFSDISTMASPGKIFKCFVDEMTFAFTVMTQLRMMYDKAKFSNQRLELCDLLHNVVNITVDFFNSVQIYLSECVEAKKNQERGLEYVEFAKRWGALVHELRAPTFALKGYTEVIHQISLSEKYEKQRDKCLVQFDELLDNNLATLSMYQGHLIGDR